MTSSDQSGQKSVIHLLEEDIKKGINEKELQNLVLQKILDVVESEKPKKDPDAFSNKKPEQPKLTKISKP